MRKIRVGLIGFGISGRFFHAPFLREHPGFDVVKVVTSQRELVASVLPTAAVITDVQSLLNSPEIDLIINCAPNQFHYSYSAAALELGKHVVVEKPFVTNSADGEKLISLAKQHGKVLTVFHNRRLDSDFLTVKKLISEGHLGKIKEFNSRMDRWRPTLRPGKWKEQPGEGSGTLYDLGSHLIDQALVLFGKPERLFADVGRQRDNGLADDYFHLVLFYDRLRVILHSSSFSLNSPRFVVLGDQGSLIKFGIDPQEDQLREAISPRDPCFGIEKERFNVRLRLAADSDEKTVVSEPGHYMSFYDELHQAITGGTPPPVDPKHALWTIQAIELAYKSSKDEKAIDFSV